QEFIKKLNRMEGTDKYRLPSEAQWEYACRAGSDRAYSLGGGSGGLEQYAWYSGNSGSKTHPVALKKPNAWGLYDMHGNVWEWCSDWKGEYPSGSVTDPQGPSSGSPRVKRGGGWVNFARYCRSAYRSDVTPSDRDNALGLRLSRTP
ncbi:MAG: formylglycine-generating enzyme family protein, partial [Deltaproteobacteria bacterium]|nr:formylglycine-generating enzyme family protein [Deltaproteobacteria bacterium]